MSNQRKKTDQSKPDQPLNTVRADDPIIDAGVNTPQKDGNVPAAPEALNTVRADSSKIESGMDRDISELPDAPPESAGFVPENATVIADAPKVSAEVIPDAVAAEGGKTEAGQPVLADAADLAKISVGDTLNLKDQNYRVISVISEGTGEAKIYLIEKDGRQFVLKYYYPDVLPDQKILKKFKGINHENIIALVDYGVYKDQFYEIMSYARGGTLTGHVPIKDSAKIKKIVSEVASGLNYCHERDIIHQDIKPDNIFFAEADGSGAMIGDFGISSMLKENDASGYVPQNFTHGYVAPEMFSIPGVRPEIDLKVDYFALGMTIIFMWKGESPFKGQNIETIANKIKKGRVDIPQDMPEELKTLVRGLIAQDPEKRWEHGEVEKWRRGQNVQAFYEVTEEKHLPFHFDTVAGKKIVANTPMELADLLETYPVMAKKHLYRKTVYDWLKDYDTPLFLKISDIVEDEYPKNQELGVFKSIYALNPEKPFRTHGGTVCRSLAEIGDALENEADYYQKILKENTDSEFYIYLDSVGHKEMADYFREQAKKSKTMAYHFNSILLQLQSVELEVKVNGQIFGSLSGLNSADAATKKELVRQLGLNDSKLNIWLMSLHLKKDSKSLLKAPVSEILFFLENLPWLGKAKAKYLELINAKNQEGRPAIVQAAVNGDLSLVQKLLALGVDIESKSDSGISALQATAGWGNKEVFYYLLNNGANIHTKNNNETTPLYAAAIYGHQEILNALLDAGADPNYAGSDGLVALNAAISNYDSEKEITNPGRPEIVKALLEHGADPNFRRSKEKSSLLYLATFAGNEAVVKLLLEKGGNPNIQTKSGWTPLLYATSKNDSVNTSLLLQYGADPNIAEDDGWNAVHLAARYCDNNILEAVLSHKGNANALTKTGLTPLYLAEVSDLKHAIEQNIKLLLNYGANPDTKKDNESTLYRAVRENKPDTVRMMLENGADPNLKNSDGWTALNHALRNGKTKMINLLLEHGADPNVADDEGWTALHMATRYAPASITKKLLEHKADPNLQEKGGWTSLHFATRYGYDDIETMRLVLKYGADPNIQKGDGWTALHQAVNKDDLERVELLLKHKADPNIAEEDQWTALHLAARNAGPEVVKALLRHGANTNAVEKDNWSPLMMAVKAENLLSVQAILDKGCNTNIKSKAGNTALSLAEKNGEMEIAQAIVGPVKKKLRTQQILMAILKIPAVAAILLLFSEYAFAVFPTKESYMPFVIGSLLFATFLYYVGWALVRWYQNWVMNHFWHYRGLFRGLLGTLILSVVPGALWLTGDFFLHKYTGKIFSQYLFETPILDKFSGISFLEKAATATAGYGVLSIHVNALFAYLILLVFLAMIVLWQWRMKNLKTSVQKFWGEPKYSLALYNSTDGTCNMAYHKLSYFVDGKFVKKIKPGDNFVTWVSKGEHKLKILVVKPTGRKKVEKAVVDVQGEDWWYWYGCDDGTLPKDD